MNTSNLRNGCETWAYHRPHILGRFHQLSAGGAVGGRTGFPPVNEGLEPGPLLLLKQSSLQHPAGAGTCRGRAAALQ